MKKLDVSREITPTYMAFTDVTLDRVCEMHHEMMLRELGRAAAELADKHAHLPIRGNAKLRATLYVGSKKEWDIINQMFGLVGDASADNEEVGLKLCNLVRRLKAENG